MTTTRVLSGTILRGVPLDDDQQSLRNCGFTDCGRPATEEPLYVITYDGIVSAVCESCYRKRLRKGEP